MWVAVCPLLFHSHTWLPLTRRSVSPKGTGRAILTCRGPAYQTSIVCVPEISDAADSGEDDDPAMSGSAGKPRFALSVSVAVIARGSFARAIEASSCAGVRLGRCGAAALASMVPPSTAPTTITAPTGADQPNLSRGRGSRSIAHLPATWSPRSLPGKPLTIVSPQAAAAGAACAPAPLQHHRRPQVVPGGNRVAWPLLQGAEIVPGRVLGRRRAVSEGVQHVLRHGLGEVTACPCQAPAIQRRREGFHPAHRPCAEHARAASGRVIGRVRVTVDALAGQRRVREHLDRQLKGIPGVDRVVLDSHQRREP